MIEQLEWNEHVVHMLPQAVINKPPSYFEAKFGTRFVDDLDGLDYYTAAILMLNGKQIFQLKRHRGNEPGTTNIYLPPELHDVESITSVISDIVMAFGLENEDIIWQRKDDPDA